MVINNDAVHIYDEPAVLQLFAISNACAHIKGRYQVSKRLKRNSSILEVYANDNDIYYKIFINLVVSHTHLLLFSEKAIDSHFYESICPDKYVIYANIKNVPAHFGHYHNTLAFFFILLTPL